MSSPTPGVPARTLQTAGAPAIVPRGGWKADETIRRARPSFAANLRLAIVHHTAGANGYTAAQSPAIVKAIQLYHVQGNGWNDIGYNFLVDRFGTVYEGRYGGIERNVVGAHAEGFNTGSVGVAVIGEYSSLAVAAKARSSLAALLAWRLDIAHVDPASTQSFISGGNARFAAGLPVFLRTVSGHRDTGFTDCPGTALYDLLNSIGGEVSRIGLPKLYAPTVSGTVPGTVRFRAKLSSPLPWMVDVYDAAGNAVASSNGTGANVDWSLGRDGGDAGELHLHDPLGPERHACPGRHRRRRHLARDRRSLRRSGDGLAERRHDLGQHDDHVHAEHARERGRARARRARRPGGDIPEGVEARRRARAPLRPGAAAGRHLPDRARSQRDRGACRDDVDAAGRRRARSGTLPSPVLPSRPTPTAAPTRSPSSSR